MLRLLASIALFFSVFLTANAQQPRYALLIGNEDYQPADKRLELPHEDVDRLAAALRKAGFADSNIIIVKDADRARIHREIYDFVDRLNAAGPDAVGFFYFSGHGGSLEDGSARQNFLIPTGEPIQWADELPLYGYSVDLVLNKFENSTAKGIFVVIDACRNTLPTRGKRGGGMKGLAPVTRPNLYIAFATSDGTFANDDGLYAQTLAAELAKPGQDANTAFFRTAMKVQDIRGTGQRPVLSPASVGSICFVSCTQFDEDANDWERLSEMNTVEAYGFYLILHPDGRYADEARQRQQNLRLGTGDPVRSATAAPAEAIPSENTDPNADPAHRMRLARRCLRDPTIAECFGYAVEFQDGKAGAEGVRLSSEIYGRLCRDGQSEACWNHALLLNNSSREVYDPKSALAILTDMCGKRDRMAVEGCKMAGYIYLTGNDQVPASPADAKLMYETACRLRDRDACAQAQSIPDESGAVSTRRR